MSPPPAVALSPGTPGHRALLVSDIAYPGRIIPSFGQDGQKRTSFSACRPHRPTHSRLFRARTQWSCRSTSEYAMRVPGLALAATRATSRIPTQRQLSPARQVLRSIPTPFLHAQWPLHHWLSWPICRNRAVSPSGGREAWCFVAQLQPSQRSAASLPLESGPYTVYAM